MVAEIADRVSPSPLRTDAWMVGWTDECMYDWMDGRMNARMVGWTEDGLGNAARGQRGLKIPIVMNIGTAGEEK